MAVSGVKKYGYGQIRDANQNAILVVSTKAACTFNVCVPCKRVRCMWPTADCMPFAGAYVAGSAESRQML